VSFKHRRRREPPALNLTPMLDVMFNLVLFFVVTTNFVQTDQTPGITVDLPRASAQTVLNDDQDLNVWMPSDGSLYVDEQAVDLPTLKDLLKKRAATNPNTMVVIKADEGVTHGRVVQVMDLARSYGLDKLAIATEAPQ
jgi:biopolymer transport protein ExbD